MLSFGSNIAALAALRRLNRSVDELGRTSERLASGLRINRASDDAAGLAIASSLNKDSRVYSQAIRNGNDAISALAIAEGSVNELSTVLTRLRELATQAANGTFSTSQRVSLDREGEALTREYNRLVGSTSFNGLNLLNGSFGRMNIQLGYGTSGVIGADISSGLQRNVGTGFSGGINTIDVSSVFEHRYADFNNDGKLDVVSANGDGLAISLGLGGGKFDTPTTGISKAYTNIEVADINKDGNMDVVFGAGTEIYTGLGDGAGNFDVTASGTSLITDVGGRVAVADFNGDGKLDIAASGAVSNGLVIMTGNGKGIFTDATYLEGETNAKFRLGDVNGDSKVDVILSNSSGVDVHLGSGAASFSAALSYQTKSISNSDIAMGDFNLDGRLDFVSIDGSYGQVHLGDGAGGFELGAPLIGTDATFSLQVGDLNADGILDIATAGANVSAYFGNGDGTFQAEQKFEVGAINDAGIEIADLNGDGVNDLSVASLGTSVLSVVRATTTTSTTLLRLNLTTQAEALAALELIETAFGRVQTELGAIGASQSRIAVALGNLASLRENSAAAESRIKDVDVATESARLTSLTILRQSGAAVLAQANQSPSLALSLLKSIR